MENIIPNMDVAGNTTSNPRDVNSQSRTKQFNPPTTFLPPPKNPTQCVLNNPVVHIIRLSLQLNQRMEALWHQLALN